MTDQPTPARRRRGSGRDREPRESTAEITARHQDRVADLLPEDVVATALGDVSAEQARAMRDLLAGLVAHVVEVEHARHREDLKDERRRHRAEVADAQQLRGAIDQLHRFVAETTEQLQATADQQLDEIEDALAGIREAVMEIRAETAASRERADHLQTRLSELQEELADGGASAPAEQPPPAPAPPAPPLALPHHAHTDGAADLKRRRRTRRGLPFVVEPGACAVCGRTLQVASPQELAETGWQVHDGMSVCDQCQSEGWQLPAGAGVPFRRPHIPADDE